MIIQIGTEIDESKILWKHREEDDWRRADIDELIEVYESIIKRENTNMRALYRRLPKGRCYGCDHPTWCPSKKVNAKRKCIQCRKRATKRRASYNE